MKIEKRGKYPGVKVHLEPDECQAFIAFAKDAEVALNKSNSIEHFTGHSGPPTYFSISQKIGSKLAKLMVDEPNLLIERTEDEILASMEKDLAKINQQKAAIAMKKDWKQVQG